MNTNVPPSGERDASSIALKTLEDLRQRLVSAQETEASAIKVLSDLGAPGAEGHTIAMKEAVVALQAARAKSVDAYDAVSRAMDHFNEIVLRSSAATAAGDNETVPIAFTIPTTSVPSSDDPV